MLRELADNAAFLRNNAGAICISLSDPAFVQSDAIVIDPELHVFAVFHEAAHFLGDIPLCMAHELAERQKVLLSSRRADGTMFELTVPICAHKETDTGP